MLTLNQLKQILKTWFSNHAEINSVYYCDDFDFNAERNIQYKTVNIEYLNSNIKDNVTNHNYKIVIADLVETDNNEMEDIVHSDCMQIAEDFFTYLQNYDEGFDFNQSSSINKFTDDTGDRASGIVFTIQLSVVRRQNWCSTPSKF